jgi:ABC-2 type transport system ATP-binding protein
VSGQPLTAASAQSLRRGIGILTETPGLWDRLTVTQNLLVYARLHRLPSPADAVARALDTFGVRSRAHEPTALLSRGLRQRVALARTLLHDPEVVLLDEPTGGLDPESARDVRAIVAAMRGSRRAVLLSTHNLDEAERIADRVAVLRTRLVAVGAPGELRARLFGARLRVVLTGDAGPFCETLRALGIADVRASGSVLSVGLSGTEVAAPAVVRRLVEAGAAVESVAPEQASLEDVYLGLLREGARPS